MRQQRSYIISRGEREVLIMVGRGSPNKEIAARLHISLSNVKQLVYSSCIKLGVDNRAQAVIKAIEKGIITPQDIFSRDEIAWFVGAIDKETIKSLVPQLERELDHKAPARQMTKRRSPRYRSVSRELNNDIICRHCICRHCALSY
jgi:DNA-binding CsgD family transcriptional regulator